MNMHIIKNSIYSIAIAAVAVSPFSGLITSKVGINISQVKVAEAATSSPQSFQVGVRDHQCSNQEGYSTNVGPGGSSPATDANAKDPDCGRISFIPGDVATTPSSESIYSQDFRIGTRVAESENGCTRDGGVVRWTPWMSEGGGSSANATAAASVNDPDCLWIHYETRPLPAGVLINNVRVGLSTGYGAVNFTPWARSGGGWSSWSGGGNISGSRVVIDVQFVEIFDAQYESDTIPDTMIQNESGDYTITMKNKATSWVSDILPSDSCETATPVNRGDTCSATVTASSNGYKLKYLDNDADFEVLTNPFPYERTIQREYIAIDYCINNLGFLESLINTAHANVRAPGPDDEPGGGGWTCPQWGLKYVLESQNINNNVSINNDATFKLNLRAKPTASNGVHTLRFQMNKTNGNELFGSVAVINISIGNPLVCTASQTVVSGNVAYYSVSLTSGQAGTVNIGMTSSPAGNPGPVMTNNPLVLNSGNGYTNLAYVSTNNVPAGVYNLTFNSTSPNLSCPAVLVVLEQQMTVDIKFNNLDGPITLGNPNSGNISWITQNASTCMASTTDVSGNPLSTTWNGPRTPANVSVLSEPSGTLAGPQTYLFNLRCVSASGNVKIDTVEVTTGAAPRPIVNLQCLGSADTLPQEGPCSVPYGTSAMLAWTTISAVSCTMSPDIGRIGLNQSVPVATGLLYSNTTFTLSCLNADGSQTSNDQVVINVVANPTFTMNCTPLTAQISPTDSTSYDIDLTPVDGFNGQVSVTGAFNGVLGKGAPALSFSNNDITLPPAGTVVGLVSTTAQTQDGTYIIIYTATSGSIQKTCEVELIVNPSPEPNPPIKVTTINTGQCGTIDITWSRNTGGVVPTSFQVYRHGSSNNSWSSLGGEIPVNPSPTYTYSLNDPSPIEPDGSNYYGVASIYNGTSSAIVNGNPSPIVPRPCTPNLSTSDKDIVSVQGRINKTFTPLDCSSASETATLPNNALFAPGDIITFRINACNTGSQTLTKVMVSDTNTNLSGLELVDSSPGGCVTSTEGDDTNFYMMLADIEPDSACSINIRATVTAPSNPSAAIYRFQNRAVIEADGISTIVRTPPYLFSISGGVPDRTETGPQ